MRDPTRVAELVARLERQHRIAALPVRDRHTRRQFYRTLDDDLVYGAEQLDRSVVARNQIRTVIETYKNTLFTVRNLVEERLRLLERKITDMRPAAANNRGVARDMDKLVDMAEDLREFTKQIKEITDRGYTPHIDDGVLLNAAPLHPLLPSWPDTKTAWKELEAGDYDWAQQAMEYWPARVKAACQTNKSFAIAHGLA